jgi:hypothetical protein
MISTKLQALSANDIPSYWVFEHYCKLDAKLVGQDVKITSPFNPGEKNPSFCIYVRGNRYFFKDFSTDNGGNHIEFIKLLHSCNGEKAVAIMLEDYNIFMLDNVDDRYIKPEGRYEVTSHEERSWTNLDAAYWTQFKIDSNVLKHYDVRPLESYVMEKENCRDITIKHAYIYGYFRSNGELYKIYQPKSKDNKFLKIDNYIQGTDQLKFDKPNLIIASSLKDIMTLYKFGYNVDYVAPDSENTIIPSGSIAMYKDRYKAICTLFDFDEAGVRSGEKYKKLYGVESVILPMSKDISDSVRDHGIDKVHENLFPLLKEALKK